MPMNLNTYLFIHSIVFCIYILSFIYSIKTVGKEQLPGYMKYFFWYPLVATCLFILFWLSHFKVLPNLFFYYSNLVSVLFHFSFITLFIIRIIDSKNKKPLLILYILFLFIIIFYLIKDFIQRNGLPFTISSIGLVIFSLIYYFQLFKNTPTVNLLLEPSFWIITGVFFGMGLNIPPYALGEYIINKNLQKEVYYLFAIIITSSYGIMHLFFIKAFTCSLLHHKR